MYSEGTLSEAIPNCQIAFKETVVLFHQSVNGDSLKNATKTETRANINHNENGLREKISKRTEWKVPI